MSKPASIIASVVIWALYALFVYLFHPALNPHTFGFWIFLLLTIGALTASVGMIVNDDDYNIFDERVALVGGSASGIAVVIWIILAIVSSPLFAAGALSSMIEPEETTFEEHADDFQISAIPLMDTESARLFGNRELGSLADVVSQFDDDPAYHQISYNGVPTKVSAVDYAGFFRWLANNSTGAPGYISVDPIDQSADYVALNGEDGDGFGNLVYTNGAYFTEDISRHVQFQFPTYSFGSNRFELNDEGHPYYVTQYYEYRTFFLGRDTAGVVITDPTNGESIDYKVGEIPEWVDDVYDGDMILSQATDHWMLGNGFWNSVLAKDGCRRTSDDFGYVDINGHIWLYTGVTSANNDSSNIGFLLVSERTKEAFYIPMASADERSAMASAEGQVQQYGYEASWPSLVSIDGQPTYVMVLKDASGVVRMYAMVNAESYNVVACEYTLDAVKTAYEKRMGESGIKFSKDGQAMPETKGGDGEPATQDDDSAKLFSTTAEKVVLADDGGDTYAYILGSDGNVYKAKFADHAAYLMGIEAGDEIEGTATEDGDHQSVEEFGKAEAESSGSTAESTSGNRPDA